MRVTRLFRIVSAVALVAAIVVATDETAHALAAPSTINFGTVAVGATKTKSVPLRFDAGYRLQEIDTGGAGAPWFTVDPGTCALNAGEPCAFKITFSPTTTGQHLGTLLIRECPISGVGDCVVVTAPINARAGVYAASPPSVDFGTVASGTVKTKAVKMKFDPGYRHRQFNGIGAPFAIDLGDCANPQGNPCTFFVSYGAGTNGVRDTTVLFTECKIVDVNSCGVIAIPIHAKTGKISAAPTRVNFGSVAPGATKTKTIKVKFDSGYQFFRTEGTANDAPFSVDPGTCTGSAGAPCALTVTYSPTIFGSNDAVLDIFQCDIAVGNMCGKVVVPLHGESGV